MNPITPEGVPLKPPSAALFPEIAPQAFTAGEGGAQHCRCDCPTLGVAEMRNRFEDRLKP